MLKANDLERWKTFKMQVERLHLRFPVAEISEKTGANKGYVSAVLKGSKPLSDNFLNNFYAKFMLPEGKQKTPEHVPEPAQGMISTAEMVILIFDKLRKIEESLIQSAKNNQAYVSAITDEIREWNLEVLKSLKSLTPSVVVKSKGKTDDKSDRTSSQPHKRVASGN
jgi:hypothetical protein